MRYIISFMKITLPIAISADNKDGHLSLAVADTYLNENRVYFLLTAFIKAGTPYSTANNNIISSSSSVKNGFHGEYLCGCCCCWEASLAYNNDASVICAKCSIGCSGRTMQCIVCRSLQASLWLKRRRKSRRGGSASPLNKNKKTKMGRWKTKEIPRPMLLIKILKH